MYFIIIRSVIYCYYLGKTGNDRKDTTMKKLSLFKSALALTLSAAMFLNIGNALQTEAGTFFPAYSNTYKDLRVPTEVAKIGDTYYITDSYHNQVIYSKGVGTTIQDWKVMANDLALPHSIASDGIVYLVTDTENHRVKTYQKTAEGFLELQTFEQIGVRPHYAVYDEASGTFYVWSSMTGQMYLFSRKPNTLEVSLVKILSVPQLYGKYVRSFTIDGNNIYLPCVDDSCIYVANKNTLAVTAAYPVPANIGGMVQVVPIQNYFYLTVSSDTAYDQSHATIVRAKSLADFGKGNYEDLNKKFGNDGAPYYISYFDGAYYTTVLRATTKPCIYKFSVTNDIVYDVMQVTF